MRVPRRSIEKDLGPEPGWIGMPRTPGETTTLVAHYYRAEVARMAGWRDRIDRPTNWAITVIAAVKT